jgi:hypothetical protein
MASPCPADGMSALLSRNPIRLDKENTLRYLEIAYRERAPGVIFLQKERVFDFLRSDECYRELGLPAIN